jgi:diaminopimelate epimerase
VGSQLKFLKMEGLGNDFVLVGPEVKVDGDVVRGLCDRRRGVGADGLLQVSPNEGVIVMGYWNADGSEAEMCGNGLRCVARYAFDQGLTADTDFEVMTPAGTRRVLVGEHPRVETGPVGVATPFVFEGRDFVPVRVGNPHAVTMVGEVGAADVAGIGARLEAATPQGVNVEFVRVTDPSHLEMRVWERGVGETLACGSGMVAAVVAAHHLGLVGELVTVRVPGGEGEVVLTEGTSWLTGPARYVFGGEFDS